MGKEPSTPASTTDSLMEHAGRPLSWCSGQLTGTMRVMDDSIEHHASPSNSSNRGRSITVAGAEGIGRFLPAAKYYSAHLHEPLP